MSEEIKISLSHPTGNANVRALAEGLLKAGVLHKFYTCVAVFQDSKLYPLTRIKFLQEFRKRVFSESLKSYTHSRPFKELVRIAALRLGKTELVYPEVGRFCIERVHHDLDLYVSRKIQTVNAVYAYEDGALQSFKKAKIYGVTCIYELPIGYWRAMRNLLEEEMYKKPEWAMTLSGFKDSEKKLNKKDTEIRLADHIFVASTFTAETLKKFPGKLAPVHIVPYGFPPVAENRIYTSLSNRSLKLFFVGGLSQRKGISYLFEAVNKLKGKVELTVIGQKPNQECKILNENLKKHIWIPRMAHFEILQFMKSQDLLIFPSLFEGFGLVITEAMSQGTPVITTQRTCGVDLIKHGENGWLVEAGSTEELLATLREILDNPSCLKKIGKAAMATARNRPWEVYGEEMAKTIAQIFKKEKIFCE